MSKTSKWIGILCIVAACAVRLIPEQESPQATYNRACELHAKGEHKEAFKLFTSAANEGHGAAQSNLGVYYSAGLATPKDDVEAVRWLTLAANQGMGLAEVALASNLREGRGTPVDLAKSDALYHRAAKKGILEAEFECGRIAKRKGNDIDANAWFIKAADKGHAMANFAIASVYLNHEDSARYNPVEGYARMLVCAKLGQPLGEVAAKKFSEFMKQSEVTAGVKRSEEILRAIKK